MAIKPILFNTDMVRKILEDKKTVTRRVVKGADALWGFEGLETDPSLIGIDKDGEEYPIDMQGLYAVFETQIDEFPTIKAPYQPGDIRYAPEAWKCRFAMLDQDGLGYEVVFRDGKIVRFRFDDKKRAKKWAKYARKNDNHWQSPYFMPREAARIFLRVTGVWVERLKDMTSNDAMNEGFTDWNDLARVWDSTIKPADRARYGWAANPWVWVISFERCEKPEGWPA